MRAWVWIRNKMKTPQQKLIDTLHSMAMYNDKGYIWYRHSDAESDAIRAKWREEIDGLIAQIGRDSFPPDLLHQLMQPEILRDDSGIYAEQVSAWLSSG